jgi:hypothetical protein
VFPSVADPARTSASRRAWSCSSAIRVWPRALRVVCVIIRPHRQSAVPAGRGERDCLAVLLPARPPERASALARATSVSRGPGRSTSCQGRSRRTLGRWIRICATFLVSSAIHPSRGPGAAAGQGRGAHCSHRPDAGLVAIGVEGQRDGEQSGGDDSPQQQHGLLPAQARVEAARLREGYAPARASGAARTESGRRRVPFLRVTPRRRCAASWPHSCSKITGGPLGASYRSPHAISADVHIEGYCDTSG